MTVQTLPVSLTRELPGRARAREVAELRPQVGGIITKRLFEEGSQVKAGQALYQIDPAPFEAQLASAQAALARAEATLTSAGLTASRYRELIGIDAISREELDQAIAAEAQAKADVGAQKAAVQTASINLNYTRITAPIDGTIGRSLVTVGALVAASQADPLATIQRLDPIYVDFTQSSTELLRLRRALGNGSLQGGPEQGAPIELQLEDGTAYPYPAKLELSEVSVDPSTGSVTLRATAENPDHVLMPGMFVRAVLTEGVDPNGIVVPQRGVTRDTRGRPVALLLTADGTVEQRGLEPERAVGNQWRVIGGLEPGERVIVEGLQRVRPGDKARAADAAPGQTTPAAPAAPAKSGDAAASH